MSEKRSLVRRGFHIFTLKRILIAVCVVVVLHTVLNIGAYLVLQKELKNARAAGIQMDLRRVEGLILSPADWQSSISEGENAANLYRAAFAPLLRSCQGEETQASHAIEDYWPEQGVPGPEVIEALRQFLELDRVALAFSLIEQANTMPKCNWGLHYQDTFSMLLSHLPGVRGAAKALLVRARLRYVTGDPSGAAADIQAVIRLAERIESDRTIVSELVQYAVLNICTDAVKQMSTAEPLDAHTAMQLCDSLAQWERLIGTTEAFKVETAAAYFWTEKVRKNPGLVELVLDRHPSPLVLRLLTSYPCRPMYRLDQARLLRYELEMVELSQEPYHTVKNRLDAFDIEISSTARTFFLTRFLMAALAKMQFNVAKARAQVRTARLGLALEACKDKTGSYPVSLAGLTPDYLPELPVDPFTGKAFLYRLTDQETLLYSVGKNGVDNGGLTETEEDGKKLNPDTDDIAWRIPR